MTAAKIEVFHKANVNVTTMDADSLRKEFLECLELTETAIRRMADIAAELIRRGEELPDLGDTFIGKWIKKIAGGLLHEKAFVKFCTNSHLLSKLENVSLKEQIEIASGEKIPIAVIKDDDNLVVVKKTPGELNRKEISLAFNEFGLRPISEQKLILRKLVVKEAKNKNKTLFIDPQTTSLKLSNSFVRCIDGRKLTVSDLVKVLSDYYNIDIEKFILKHAEKL